MSDINYWKERALKAEVEIEKYKHSVIGDFAEEQHKRDIEQQIKGVRELVRVHGEYDNFASIIIREHCANDFIEQLHKELEK